MSTIIVTEGEQDRELIRKLLVPPLPEASVRCVIGGGRSGAVSVARTMLSTTPDRVALVLDADTTNQLRIETERSELEALLRLAGEGRRGRVFLAVPEIEVVLFHDPEAIRRVFGEAFDTEMRVRARFEPKRVIQTMMENRGTCYSVQTVGALAVELGLTQLRQSSLIGELLAFVTASARAAVA